MDYDGAMDGGRGEFDRDGAAGQSRRQGKARFTFASTAAQEARRARISASGRKVSAPLRLVPAARPGSLEARYSALSLGASIAPGWLVVVGRDESGGVTMKCEVRTELVTDELLEMLQLLALGQSLPVVARRPEIVR